LLWYALSIPVPLGSGSLRFAFTMPPTSNTTLRFLIDAGHYATAAPCAATFTPRITRPASLLRLRSLVTCPLARVGMAYTNPCIRTDLRPPLTTLPPCLWLRWTFTFGLRIRHAHTFAGLPTAPRHPALVLLSHIWVDTNLTDCLSSTRYTLHNTCSTHCQPAFHLGLSDHLPFTLPPAGYARRCPQFSPFATPRVPRLPVLVIGADVAWTRAPPYRITS